MTEKSEGRIAAMNDRYCANCQEALQRRWSTGKTHGTYLFCRLYRRSVGDNSECLHWNRRGDVITANAFILAAKQAAEAK